MNNTERIRDRVVKSGKLPIAADQKFSDSLRGIAMAVEQVLEENASDVDSVEWAARAAYRGKQLALLRYEEGQQGMIAWIRLHKRAKHRYQRLTHDEASHHYLR